MKTKKINKFRGLLENVSSPDRPGEYADSIVNLDVDNPFGQLTLRDGYQKKYSDTFSDIWSVFEYKFPTSGDVITLINDEGTFELYNDGVKGTNLTLPDDATLESRFKNNYFGKDDYILITTGNGSTNYMLWYGYTQRLAANNDGLFNDTVVDSGTYRLLKAQLIDGCGVFSNIHNVIYIDGYYYITLGNRFYSDYLGLGFQSSFIEKRDTNFNLVDKLEIYYNSTNIGSNKRISLTEDGTYIYAAAEDDIYKIDPATFEVVEYTSLTSNNIQSIGNDGSYLYAVTGNHIYKRLLTDLSVPAGTADTSTTVASANEILVPDSGNYFYVTYTSGTDHIVQQRNLTDLAVNDSVTVHTGTYGINYLGLSDDGLTIYVNGIGAVALYAITISTFTSSSINTYDDTIYGFCKVSGTTLRGIALGGLLNLSDGDVVAPNIVNIWAYTNSNTGDFVAGTYFYKYSIVDTDGQEYTLSDPVTVQHTVDSRRNNTVYVCFNKNAITSGYAYRIKFINLYRAYSTEIDAEIPDTEYRLLKTIDINSSTWDNIYGGNYADYHIYQYYDDTTEGNISSLTYLENAGISDNVKPRYVNPKFMTFLNDRLYVSNFYCDNETYLNGILRSPVNSPSSIALYDYFDFGSSGHETKGLTSAYGRLVAFKELDFGIFYDAIFEHSDNYGISADMAFAKYNDDIYFCNADGIFLLRGQNVERVSQPIEATWAGLSFYTTIALFVFNDKDRLIVTNGSYTFVHNIRYKTWVRYAHFSFAGYYRNSANEYIGYGDPRDADTDYLFKINTGIDNREVNGTGGTNISITYNSQLLNFDNNTGMLKDIFSVGYRSKSSTGNTLSMYKYSANTRTSILSSTVTPGTTYKSNYLVYPDGAFGESFSWHLSGGTSLFEFDEITFTYEDVGVI